MSDIDELKRFVKSLQQASAEQVCYLVPFRSIRLYIRFLLICVSFHTGNRRHPPGVEEGGQDHRGRS